LAQGGDHHSKLDAKGKNHYLIKPYVMNTKKHPFRASCSANSPTIDGFNAAFDKHQLLQENPGYYPELMEEVRQKISDVFSLPAGCGIFLTPSGSDAEFIPLLVAKTLNPGSSIENLLVYDTQIGYETLVAAGGMYFSEEVPIPGLTQND
jgi:hypothetical protein